MPDEEFVVVSEDNKYLRKGDRAFNYYDRKYGTLGEPWADGWFTFHHDDGTRCTLNGERVCSIEYAQQRGW